MGPKKGIRNVRKIEVPTDTSTEFELGWRDTLDQSVWCLMFLAASICTATASEKPCSLIAEALGARHQDLCSTYSWVESQ